MNSITAADLRAHGRTWLEIAAILGVSMSKRSTERFNASQKRNGSERAITSIGFWGA